ncbi:hypothetical protein PO124_04545 [Bacillus licheniformis]|nr:hypothetical protein [Bacillus licheniformis]
MVTSWFPEQERASAIAFIRRGNLPALRFDAGAQRHPACRRLARPFIVTGVIGIIWGLIWYIFIVILIVIQR